MSSGPTPSGNPPLHKLEITQISSDDPVEDIHRLFEGHDLRAVVEEAPGEPEKGTISAGELSVSLEIIAPDGTAVFTLTPSSDLSAAVQLAVDEIKAYLKETYDYEPEQFESFSCRNLVAEVKLPGSDATVFVNLPLTDNMKYLRALLNREAIATEDWPQELPSDRLLPQGSGLEVIRHPPFFHSFEVRRADKKKPSDQTGRVQALIDKLKAQLQTQIAALKASKATHDKPAPGAASEAIQIHQAESRKAALKIEALEKKLKALDEAFENRLALMWALEYALNPVSPLPLENAESLAASLREYFREKRFDPDKLEFKRFIAETAAMLFAQVDERGLRAEFLSKKGGFDLGAETLTEMLVRMLVRNKDKDIGKLDENDLKGFWPELPEEGEAAEKTEAAAPRAEAAKKAAKAAGETVVEATVRGAGEPAAAALPPKEPGGPRRRSLPPRKKETIPTRPRSASLPGRPTSPKEEGGEGEGEVNPGDVELGGLSEAEASSEVEAPMQEIAQKALEGLKTLIGERDTLILEIIAAGKQILDQALGEIGGTEIDKVKKRKLKKAIKDLAATDPKKDLIQELFEKWSKAIIRR
ncbi:MAG: hypothetical protein WC371_04045 [Parachlamydiales bacterium]